VSAKTPAEPKNGLDAERPPRFGVGIDLGTTNSAVAYVETGARRPEVKVFPLPQITDAGETESLETLPSVHYEPAAAELGESGAAPYELPWGAPWRKDEPPWVVGAYARQRGARVPARLVTSAKSWLSHSRVDRRASLLPLHGAPDLRKLSPVEASARYLAHVRSAWDHAFPEYPLAEQDVVLTVPASFDEIARELTVEAARDAGLPRVHLLEEPQAAFYAWIEAAGEEWDREIEAGQSILVCDVGGGTTDLSLIEVRQAEQSDDGGGPVRFHRIAVGDHLLLGGDNMDLALAHHVESQLTGEDRLGPEAWSVLVRQCQHVKELLLGENPPAAATVSLPGGGSKLVGGALQLEVSREQVVELLLDGFLPRAALTDTPRARTGFQEFGLPYAPDPGVTRYAASFLGGAGVSRAEQGKDESARAHRPDYLLFNGGVFESAAIRQRMVEAISGWFDEDPSWELRLLENQRLDLAVASGAAYYARVRRGAGVRISGGLALTYYVGVETEPGELGAVCLIPAGLEEGDAVELDREFDLRIRQPVEFPVFVSASRTTDAPGDLIAVSSEELRALPAIRTVLRSGRKSAADTVGVRLTCRLSEVGTLDIGCREATGDRRWRLRFDARSASRTDIEAYSSTGEAEGVLDEASISPVRELLEDTFGAGPDRPSNAPDQLVGRVEKATGISRHEWPPSLLRDIWEQLLELSAGRRKSDRHEARWLNLLGWSLRPGYGLALDDWRSGQTWRFFLSTKVQYARNEQCRAEWWILWRRIAGGLSAGQQLTLAGPLVRLLADPVDQGKARPKGSAAGVPFHGGSHETAEAWRLLGALEWLEPRTKILLGDRILEALKEAGPRLWNRAGVWALGRLGARAPQYGPLNTLVPVETVEVWLDQLLRWEERDEGSEDDLGRLSFSAVQLARRTEDRYRDVGAEIRGRVVAWLESRNAPGHYRELVEAGGTLDAEEQAAAFGESLPTGIRLRP
jgi:molecular chaperone DnaK (HSP70)